MNHTGDWRLGLAVREAAGKRGQLRGNVVSVVLAKTDLETSEWLRRAHVPQANRIVCRRAEQVHAARAQLHAGDFAQVAVDPLHAEARARVPESDGRILRGGARMGGRDEGSG